MHKLWKKHILVLEQLCWKFLIHFKCWLVYFETDVWKYFSNIHLNASLNISPPTQHASLLMSLQAETIVKYA